MSVRWQSPLPFSVLCAALVGASANVARAQCNHGGGGGPRFSQTSLQQQMMLRQQQLLLLQQLQQRQLMQTVQLERKMLDLVEQGPEALQTALHDPKAEKRLLAAVAVGRYGPALTDDLIELLTDDNRLVRQAARQSLVSISTKGDGKTPGRRVDFGPAPDAKPAVQKAAAGKWRTWFEKQQMKTAKLDAPVAPAAR